ncbi:MAG: hypothetical protein CMJ18_23790 [Phycisphaeraceae bacterium]|nr:hypothetical protein [Phycisphaeraceae bacterium]
MSDLDPYIFALVVLIAVLSGLGNLYKEYRKKKEEQAGRSEDGEPVLLSDDTDQPAPARKPSPEEMLEARRRRIREVAEARRRQIQEMADARRRASGQPRSTAQPGNLTASQRAQRDRAIREYEQRRSRLGGDKPSGPQPTPPRDTAGPKMDLLSHPTPAPMSDPAPISEADPSKAAAPSLPPVSSQRRGGGRLRKMLQRTDLRDAIVLREIIEPPLALRDQA